MSFFSALLLLISFGVGDSSALVAADLQDTTSSFIVEREFIYQKASFPSAHASTIAETPSGTLLSAWFGGTSEGNDDVEIYLSRKKVGSAWSTPVALTDIRDMPTWNPVLFQDGVKTWLFFKVGPNPREWVGAYRTSRDDGKTWGPIVYLPAGLTGPVRAKPIRLSDGTWLAGTSVEAGIRADTREDAPYRAWAVWVERSTDRGKTWTKQGPITVPGEPFGVIQPTLWEGPHGRVHMLMRSTERIGRIVSSSSNDRGLTWSPGRPTDLPNPNAGIDVVRLRDGRLLLVYNPTHEGRTPISIAVSEDNGTTWSRPYTLEDGPGEYSYPAVIQTKDGLVHITYTWKRTHIRHLVVDPSRIPR